MEVRPVDERSVDDLGELLCTEKTTAGCWCMWFIVPVKDYHAAHGEGNRASFCELIATSKQPLGLIAYLGERPMGWCAAGPRSRYARAIRTPTYLGRDPEEDDDVWLLPCLFVRKEARGTGISEHLVRAAVGMAREHGASAIEAFPFAHGKRHSKDMQVGFETTFSRCSFGVIRRPPGNRAVMRLQLGQ